MSRKIECNTQMRISFDAELAFFTRKIKSMYCTDKKSAFHLVPSYFMFENDFFFSLPFMASAYFISKHSAGFADFGNHFSPPTKMSASFVVFFFSFVGNFYDAPHGFNLIALNASPVEKKSEAEFFAIQMQLIFSSIQNDDAIACISILFSSFRFLDFFFSASIDRCESRFLTKLSIFICFSVFLSFFFAYFFRHGLSLDDALFY